MDSRTESQIALNTLNCRAEDAALRNTQVVPVELSRWKGNWRGAKYCLRNVRSRQTEISEGCPRSYVLERRPSDSSTETPTLIMCETYQSIYVLRTTAQMAKTTRKQVILNFRLRLLQRLCKSRKSLISFKRDLLRANNHSPCG
jgi:hypothetical protein